MHFLVTSLQNSIKYLGSVAVAYSGSVDSTFFLNDDGCDVDSEYTRYRKLHSGCTTDRYADGSRWDGRRHLEITLKEWQMILKAILFSSYLLLRSALVITTIFHPSFKKRLMERDLEFAVRMKAGTAAGLFKLKEGNLLYNNTMDEFINFTVVWNGWGRADTFRKRLQLNLFDLLNTGMVTVEGDISSLSYLLVVLGEMIKCFQKNQLTALKRAELKKEPA